MSKVLVKEESQKDNIEPSNQASKLKNAVDALTSALIRVNALQEKINLLEKKIEELDKIPLIIELLQKESSKREKLEKNLFQVLKDVYVKNQDNNKIITLQLKKVSDKLNQCFNLRLWKLPEINVFSLFFTLLLLLTGLSLVIAVKLFFYNKL